MQIGDMVMVRDPWIKESYHVPPAEIMEIKSCGVLLRKSYLLKFHNGVTEWFDYWTLKTE